MINLVMPTTTLRSWLFHYGPSGLFADFAHLRTRRRRRGWTSPGPRRLWFGSVWRAFDVSRGGPVGELAGVVGVFHFHQAGQLANEFDSAPQRIIEFLTRRDVIADCIP